MPDDNLWTSDALERGDIVKIKERVLSQPEYLEERDEYGNTPLLTAIAFEHVPLVRFLLEHQANPNVEVDDGYTCLLTAVESEAPDSLQIITALIEAGADVGATGINGWTPLHMAAARGHVEKTRMLIEAGAVVDCRTAIDGCETPLMEAAYSGQPETVQLLLDAGADPALRETVNDRTPLEIAQYVAQGPDPEVTEVLREEDMKIDFDDIVAEMDLAPEALEAIKQSMQDYDMVESYISNSQALVEQGNHAEVIRILGDLKGDNS